MYEKKVLIDNDAKAVVFVYQTVRALTTPIAQTTSKITSDVLNLQYGCVPFGPACPDDSLPMYSSSHRNSVFQYTALPRNED